MATESFFDGCHDTELFLEGFTLSEAYHQLINFTARKNNNQIEIPAIISREENIWNFSDLDAIQELQLHDLGGGRFKITLSSCT
jgi:glutaredoxin